MDPLTGDPAILLADNTASAIITAPAEPGGAESIICELEGIHRDGTHSLLYRFFVRHGIRVNRLEIGQDSRGRLSSALCYRHDERSYRMDMSPADGISLAIQAGAPMFASAELIHESTRTIASPRVMENRDLLLLSSGLQSRFPQK
jgi:bifunctional DNase/RNase